MICDTDTIRKQPDTIRGRFSCETTLLKSELMGKQPINTESPSHEAVPWTGISAIEA